MAILFAEYGILGLFAGIIGAFFAVILSYVVSEYLLNISWAFNLHCSCLRHYHHDDFSNARRRVGEFRRVVQKAAEHFAFAINSMDNGR